MFVAVKCAQVLNIFMNQKKNNDNSWPASHLIKYTRVKTDSDFYTL